MLTRRAAPEGRPPQSPGARKRPGGPQWIHGPVLDAGLAVAWLPFVVVVHLVESDPAVLRAAISAVFLVSFAHQPLTLALVYGDSEQFRLRRAVFTFSPFLLAGATFMATRFDPVVLALVAGSWNTEHTLMQRYGIARIYGRKAGQLDGRLERAMLFSWLALAVVVVAGDGRTPERLARMQLGDTNRIAVEMLTRFQAVAIWLVVPAVLVATWVALAWLRDEVRRGARTNPAKWCYLGSTAALFLVILVDPIAGLMGYVGAHAIEYFVIVHQSLGRRYRDAPAGVDCLLARSVRARPGPLGFLAAYLAAVLALVGLLQWYGSESAYMVVFFTLGGLHVFYDGFIWKLRRPAVALSLDIHAAGAE